MSTRNHDFLHGSPNYLVIMFMHGDFAEEMDSLRRCFTRIGVDEIHSTAKDEV